MINEFQVVIKAINDVKNVKISSDLLEKLLPNFHIGLQIFIEDLSKEYKNQEILKLIPKFNAVLEVATDGFENILIVRVPMLERMLNDPDAHLSEYVSTFDHSEKESLRKLGLIA